MLIPAFTDAGAHRISEDCMNSYHAYEAAKRFWVQSHPNATAAEYEAACARLAKQYGI